MFEINALCQERNWTRARLILELRRAAKARGRTLPPDDSLRRMIREWAKGTRGLSEFYVELFGDAFGLPVNGRSPVAPGKLTPDAAVDDSLDDLADRLTRAANVDLELVALLESQTDSLRTLDRRLGAPQVLVQTEAHIAQMSDLLAHSLPGPARSGLAAAVAEAAALAGWQALDLGKPAKSWRHHETAKAAALESGSPAILAHVTAQQAYALLDLEHTDQALALVRHARTNADGRVPPLLRSWLHAAEAEAFAACGEKDAAQRSLDLAASALPAESSDPDLPFLFLNEIHLARWRGSCLARVGAIEAIDYLNRALDGLDSTFTRAAAGHQCELAMAYAARGQHEEARRAARRAAELAKLTSSVRQRRRISRLLSGDEAHRGR